MKYFLAGTWVNDDTINTLPPGATRLSDAEWTGRQGTPFIPPWAQAKADLIDSAEVNSEKVVSRLEGIAGRRQRSGDSTTAAACDAVADRLLDMDKWPGVRAANDAAQLKNAVSVGYAEAKAMLPPALQNAFRGLA